MLFLHFNTLTLLKKNYSSLCRSFFPGQNHPTTQESSETHINFTPAFLSPKQSSIPKSQQAKPSHAKSTECLLRHTMCNSFATRMWDSCVKIHSVVISLEGRYLELLRAILYRTWSCFVSIPNSHRTWRSHENAASDSQQKMDSGVAGEVGDKLILTRSAPHWGRRGIGALL